MTKRSPDAQRLLDARKAAAKELGLEPSDWRVRRYALLALSIEAIEAGFATGEDLDTDALSKIDAQMQQIRDTLPPEKHQVSVKFVEGAYGIFNCQHCGQRNEIEPGGYRSLSGYYEIEGPRGTGSPMPPLHEPKPGAPVIESTANKPVEAVKTSPG